MPPILSESVSNPVENMASNHTHLNDVNDYVYDMIFIKTKRATNNSIQRNKKFVKKHMNNDDPKKESSKLKNVLNVLKQEL
jgi:hypothetical protein